MPDRFVSMGLDEIIVGEDLPGNIYLYIQFRFVTLRGVGDCVDRSLYERLELKKIKSVFIKEDERAKFDAWKAEHVMPEPPEPHTEAERAVRIAKMDAHRAAYDIFQSGTLTNQKVIAVLESTKKLVDSLMITPFTSQTIGHLQSFSRGTADHSVNVSVLSVYLAMQMGYTHSMILQHVGMGGLLHDVGKIYVELPDEISDEEADTRLLEHPATAAKKLEAEASVPKEVRMIIEQHHECWDGTGFPAKLRGPQIYDLARIVALANRFDELVAEGKGSLVDRQRKAVDQLQNKLYRQFDPQKLEKAVKILKLGI